MSVSPSIRRARPEDSPAIAGLHCREIPWGLLSSQGAPFVESFYDALIGSPAGFAFMAADKDRVVGFASAVTDWRRLYGESLRSHIRITAQTALSSLLKGRWRSVLETPPHSAFVELPSAELVSIAVEPGLRRGQLGALLVRSILDEFAARSVPAVRVIAGGSNAHAARLYEKTGFRRYAEVEITPEEVVVIYVIVLDGRDGQAGGTRTRPTALS